MRINCFVLNFKMGKSSTAVGAVIDNFFITINKTIMIKFGESRQGSGNDIRFKRIVIAGPIHRETELFHLKLVKLTIVFDKIPNKLV